ncbi:MAG: hypothetical protein ACOY15_02950 [Pseudomonadota bacterium]
MTQNLKFTFRNLDARNSETLPASFAVQKKRSYTDSQIKEIQDAAFAEGVIAGEDSALLKIEKKAEETLSALFSQYSTLISEVSGHIAILRRQSAELALVIAKKLASVLIAENPTAEIETLFLSCLVNLNTEPRIVLKVDEKLIDILKEKIDRITITTGYPGRVILIGVPDTAPAQCVIEWADGGVSYRSPEQLEHIDQVIANYVSRAGSIDAGEEPDFVTPKYTEIDANQQFMDSTK